MELKSNKNQWILCRKYTQYNLILTNTDIEAIDSYWKLHYFLFKWLCTMNKLHVRCVCYMRQIYGSIFLLQNFHKVSTKVSKMTLALCHSNRNLLTVPEWTDRSLYSTCCISLGWDRTNRRLITVGSQSHTFWMDKVPVVGHKHNWVWPLGKLSGDVLFISVP